MTLRFGGGGISMAGGFRLRIIRVPTYSDEPHIREGKDLGPCPLCLSGGYKGSCHIRKSPNQRGETASDKRVESTHKCPVKEGKREVGNVVLTIRFRYTGYVITAEDGDASTL